MATAPVTDLDLPDFAYLDPDLRGPRTTQSQLAHGLRLLAEHPDQWDALEHLAPRMKDPRLGGEPAHGSIDGIYGLDALPLRWS